MSLYSADPKDGVAWITGASAGIGRRLALDLAKDGYVVAATARDENELQSLAREGEGRAGRIVPFLCDVTDEASMERTVTLIEQELGPIVLAVLNAGIYYPTYGERLESYNFASTYAVNLMGVVHGLVPVCDRMRDRGFGQIAIIGSVSSYFGFPAAAAYGSSKAALNSLAQSLRYDLEKLNIRIQIINPGFIATQLIAKYDFRGLGMIQPADASARIAAAIRRGRFETSFPRRAAWPLKLLGLLPNGLTFRLVGWLSGWNRRRFGRRRGRR